MTSHKPVALLLLLSFSSALPVSAGDIRDSAERHAMSLAAQSGPGTVAAAVNPHRKAALILGGVGAATLAIGLLRNVPKQCADLGFTAYCSVGSDTKLVVAGLGVMAAGGAMYLVGEGKKKSVGIGIVPDGVRIEQRIRF